MVVRIPLRKGTLGKFGYTDVKEKSFLARKRALMRAIRYGGETPLAVFRRLNVLMILNKNKDPVAYRIFKRDRDWIGKKLNKE
jgi:hypothetical protein